ncbi:MAG: hypothetical protein DRQ44_02425 [Gammaproteobacteria bacterium]|nr:MAG: hypothetical protein DRQ44_02425 [Gammaproteobacteria bacterium]
MSFMHFYNFSRLRYLLALILVLPLVACSGGDAGVSGSGDAVVGSSGSAKLSWTAPSAREDNSELVLSDIAGFRIYYGSKSRDYSNTIDIDDHTATQAVLAGLPSGTYFVAVTTVDVDGRESSWSTPELKVSF